MDTETLLLLRDFATLFLQPLTAIIATIFFYKYKNSLLKYFLYYLWFVVLVEYLGFLLGEFDEDGSNHLLYNIFYVISFAYLFYLYNSVLRKKRKIVKYSYFAYLLAFIINAFFEDYTKEFQTIPYIIGSCLLILAIVWYFAEILVTEKVLHVKRILLFWISTGLLLFYTGSIPFTITFNYYAKAEGFNFLFAINYSLIIILNLCYIIGFIWSNRKQLY